MQTVRPAPWPRAAKDHLSTLSGAAFDKAYMDYMVTDHENAVALFWKEASGDKDADTKDWASKTLSTLQEHLAKAREVAGKTSERIPALAVGPERFQFVSATWPISGSRWHSGCKQEGHHACRSVEVSGFVTL